MSKIPTWFENYHSLLESQLKILTDGMKNNTKEIKAIKDNHLVHIDEKLNKVNVNQGWIMGIGAFILTTSIGILLTNIFG